MAKKSFKKNTKYLHIPIHDEHPDNFHYIKVYDGERLAREFYIGVAMPSMGKKPHFYVAMFLGDYKSDSITLVCDEDVPQDYFDGIKEGDEPLKEKGLYPDLYKEPIRQQIHFSPRCGWCNDPNGLFFKDGKFNLYFQHNPYGAHHAGVNVSWGHAVSTDCVHYTEFPDVILPYDSRCLVASGSALVDKMNISGMGEGTILAAYTALQANQYRGREKNLKNDGQMLLYSTDEGMTFQFFENNPIIPVPEPFEWRDPKLLFKEGKLCVVVSETYEGEKCASVYVSEDCNEFNLVAREFDIYECPDLFPLEIAETGEELWVLYGGIGKYSIGIFDDFKFTAIEKDHYIDYGENLYAGQTFNDFPSKTLRYHTAWLLDSKQRCRVDENYIYGKAGSQSSLSLITELSIHKTKNGYRLFRKPNDNLKTLRKTEEKVNLADAKISTPEEYVFTLDTETAVTVTVGGKGFTYDPESKKIISTSGKEYDLCSQLPPTVRLFVDTRSAEFFVSDEIGMSFFTVPDGQKIEVEGTDAIDATKYSLESIWQTTD